MEDEVVLRMNRRNLLWATVVSLGFVGLGAGGLRRGNPLGVLMGALAMGIFGLAFIVLVIGLLRPRPVVTIGGSGLRFGGFAWRRQRVIPWAEIAGLRIYRFEAAPLAPGRRMLGIVPADPSSPSWTHNGLQRMSTRMAGVPASISDQSVNLELEEIAQLMQRFKPTLQINYGPPRASGLGRLTRPRNPGGPSAGED